MTWRQGRPTPLKGPTEVGTGVYDDKTVVLSELVDKLNERFGIQLSSWTDQWAEIALELRLTTTPASS